MKKTMKRFIALTLVLVLTLSLFAGCEGSVKTSDEYLLSEYGMTFEDSSSSYTGAAQSVEVTVGSAASGKDYSVTYTYEKNGVDVAASNVIDAGTYEVVAEISDSSSEVYYLTADFTITAATLAIDVPDQFVRTGSDATDASTVFADLELLGDDSVADLGLSWDVDDIDDIDAMTELSEGITLGVESTTSNYAVSVSKGTLYVLSYADYTAVGTLNLDAANLVAYNERFDELTYSENNAYYSAASRVLNIFDSADSYTAIQLAMIGDVSESTIRTNQALANTRTSQGYSLDWDTVGEISTGDIEVSDAYVFAAVASVEKWDSTLTASDEMTVTDEDDEEDTEPRYYIDNGFLIDYEENGRDDEDEYSDYEDEVVYGDYFYFVIEDYNVDTTGDYIIETLYVRNKEVDYDSGTAVDITIGSTTKSLRVYELRVDSTTLGAIGSSADIEILVEASSKYYVDTFNLEEEDNAAVSSIYIESSDDTAFKYTGDSASDEATYGYFVSGEEYELEIYMLDGYTVSSITIGDDLVIDGSELVDNSYTFYVTEDTFGVDAGDEVEIIVETIKSFETDVKINSRTIRYTDGTYESSDDSGYVIIDGLTLDGSTTYIVEGSTLDFQFVPADNYYVTNVIIYANNVAYSSSSDFDLTETSTDDVYTGTIDLIEEVTSDGRLYIDFSEDCEYFDFEDMDDSSEIQIQVTFAEKYEFEVVSDDVTFKQNAAGEWVSDYGVISVLNIDQELLESIAKGEYFTVYAELEPGYIISKIKVNTTTSTLTLTSGDDLSDYAQGVYDDSEAYFFSNSIFNSSDPDFSDMNSDDGITVDGKTYYGVDIYYDSSNYRLDAGEAITIEVEFDTYYEVEFDSGLGTSSRTTYTASTGSANDVYETTKGDMVIFGSDDSSDFKFTIELLNEWYQYYYEKHTGYTYGSSEDDDDDDDIDEIIFWAECEDEELDDFTISSSKFDSYADSGLTSGSTHTISVGFDDLFDLVSPGDSIVIYLEYEIEYN